MCCPKKILHLTLLTAISLQLAAAAPAEEALAEAQSAGSAAFLASTTSSQEPEPPLTPQEGRLTSDTREQTAPEIPARATSEVHLVSEPSPFGHASSAKLLSSREGFESAGRSEVSTADSNSEGDSVPQLNTSAAPAAPFSGDAPVDVSAEDNSTFDTRLYLPVHRRSQERQQQWMSDEMRQDVLVEQLLQNTAAQPWDAYRRQRLSGLTTTPTSDSIALREQEH
ncbi:uncharacterized protein LOC34619539 [Cyclospora cayetanensis]|uniref:Uncharacterized protein LOC34619539 n=2 Tax=Cyclospora cayetanensis TaxID=88456 RepID=A0A6P5WCZ8_9EIME|nr:uncharacterized protein LOC34619539 [Cyclospora cayetanensis]OEH76172.1 FIK kinase (incomplete catalytic triad) [Cyclospora cayetanensis]